MTLSFQPLWPILLFLWMVWFTVLPGYLTTCLLWQKRLDLYERVGVSFALGFLIFSFLGLLGYLFRLPLGALFWGSSSITVLLGLAILLARIFKWFPETAQVKNLDWKIGMVLIIVALLCALFSFGSGWYPRGDAAIHLQAIRKIADQTAITQPIYSLNTKPVLWDHAYDTYYLLIALIAKHSGLDLTVVWHYLSGILALLFPFVIYTLLKALEASRKLIFNGLFFFLLLGIFYPRPMHGTVFDALVYPNRVYLWLLLPIALALFLKYLRHGAPTYGIASALVTVFQLLIHQNGFLFYYWILGGVFLLGLVLCKYRGVIIRRTAFALGLTTTVALPLLWLKWPYNQTFVHLATQYESWQRYYHFVHVNEQFYAFDPRALLTPEILIALLIVSSAAYRLFRMRTQQIRLLEVFLIASVLVPVLVVYNPILMPAVSRFVSYCSVGRMMRMPLFYMIYAYGLTEGLQLLSRVLKNRIHRLILTGGTYLVLGAVFLCIAQPGYDTFRRLNYCHEVPAIAQVVQKIKPGSLVLSDQLTSTDAVEFADFDTLVLQFNGPVDLVNIEDGKEVVTQVLSKDVHLLPTIRPLLRNGVNYVLIDREFAARKEIFDLAPFLFKEIYHDTRYVLYQLNSQVDLNQCKSEAKILAEQHYRQATLMLDKGDLLGAFNESRYSLLLFPDNLVAKFNEQLRVQALQAGQNSPLFDVALMSNGTTVEQSSTFHPMPHDVEAALDGEGTQDGDYAAGYYLTGQEENYFVLDLGMPRWVSELKILWYGETTFGESWILEYYDGTQWQLFQLEQNWTPCSNVQFYEHTREVRVKMEKIRFRLLKGHGQDRIVMKSFSLY